MNVDAGWENSWFIFTRTLDSKLQEGATDDELSEFFGGHQICWNGIIEDLNIDELAAVVNMTLPEHVIRLSGGAQIRLDGLTLAVAESDIEKWQGLNPGDKVDFTATLTVGSSPFRCIEVISLSAERSIVMIRIQNAVPTGIAST